MARHFQNNGDTLSSRPFPASRSRFGAALVSWSPKTDASG
jgi:hypothetical protein